MIPICLVVFLIGMAFLTACVAARTQHSDSLRWLRAPSRMLLLAGLSLSLLSAGSAASPAFARRISWLSVPALGPLSLIFLPAAVFHSLSVESFRWQYDNNPLIFSSLALVIWAAPRFLGRASTGRRLALWSPATAAVIIVLMVPRLTNQISAVLVCRTQWPEIRHLDVARLRPDAIGMRDLVACVRSSCQRANQDQVLLLPEDPNVEAWLDRSRPNLSSAIIFADQYWDRWVEADFAALEKDPPRVIIIGPRDTWRRFGRLWHVNEGAERLIDLVRLRLLPDRYVLAKEQPILFHGGGKDFMDIYVRRDDR